MASETSVPLIPAKQILVQIVEPSQKFWSRWPPTNAQLLVRRLDYSKVFQIESTTHAIINFCWNLVLWNTFHTTQNDKIRLSYHVAIVHQPSRLCNCISSSIQHFSWLKIPSFFFFNLTLLFSFLYSQSFHYLLFPSCYIFKCWFP